MARRRWLSLAATTDCTQNFYLLQLQRVCRKSSPFGCGQQVDGGHVPAPRICFKSPAGETLPVTVPCEKGNSKIVVADSKSSSAGAALLQPRGQLVRPGLKRVVPKQAAVRRTRRWRR